ncbi:DegT/DnrJ/EryC1/StrS family aminotransferase [Algoriphagus sediminis]|uniref:DegT/DnrJ/EryC1/StrS family aminotransferase n=1 Tax=Algoriphagus sediminis TaxID=3057113 RepID=A0ABT7Y8H5_9BACT|nr:DegT/DnrJ/EryC1/StrS family aminotransferase [Algoriphagus sediminis]MDN3202823.1 DegT/DnrJ/EryC1/StrS family aminotransferase [Algoriphagus sediminis]
MIVPFLDLKRVSAAQKEKLSQAFEERLEEGLYSGGLAVTDFQRELEKFLGVNHAIGLGNGTDSLEMALRALGVGEGDEVIVPALTWVSTAEVVKLVGATPVFSDTDENGLIGDGWTELCTVKTKAIIPVHLYGKMVYMESLIKEAKRKNLWVIEDAAQSFGAVQNGRASGTIGDIGALSFYPTKNLGALGEAGACTSHDQELAEKIALLSNHGQSQRDAHELSGRNARIDTLQAAFLSVQLSFFQEQQIKRKEIAKKYLEAFADLEELDMPKGILSEDHNAHLFVIKSKKRDELRSFLKLKGIRTALHYPMILPDMSPFRVDGDFSKARSITKTCLSIPLNPFLTDQEIDYVIKTVRDFYTKK